MLSSTHTHHHYIKIVLLATVTVCAYSINVAMIVTLAYCGMLLLQEYYTQPRHFGTPTKQNVEAYVNWCRKHRKTIDITRCFGVNLQGMVWDGIDLQGAIFKGAKLNGTRMVGANLQKVNFDGCSLKFTNCLRTDFSGAIFHRSDVSYANMRFTVMEGADIRSLTFFAADFRHSSMQGVKYEQALPNTECVGCDLTDLHRTVERRAVKKAKLLNTAVQLPAMKESTLYNPFADRPKHQSSGGFRYYHAYHPAAVFGPEREGGGDGITTISNECLEAM